MCLTSLDIDHSRVLFDFFTAAMAFDVLDPVHINASLPGLMTFLILLVEGKIRSGND